MTRIAFLRHGPTAWNRAGRIQGRSDIPLDIAARAEMESFALPEAWQTAGLWSSPLGRAVDTARALTGRAPRTSGDLIEMHWGSFEGQRGADLIADPGSGYRHLEDWGWDFCPPEGETPRAVAERVLTWARRQDQQTIAVTHIGVMRAALACAHGWDFRGAAPFQIKRRRLYVIEVTPDSVTPLGVVRLVDRGPRP